MKHISKGDEPSELADFKACANDDWQPSFNGLDRETKKVIKGALMAEQGYICCYCEQEITDKDSHIEHFKPQSKYPDKALDYDNLLCSCQKNLHKAQDSHCGNLKGNWFDSNLLISPLESACEGRFVFSFSGKIEPAEKEDSAAKETISRFGLDIPRLRESRKTAIDTFTDESLSQEDFIKYLTIYLKKDASGKFFPFWTTIKVLFGDNIRS